MCLLFACLLVVYKCVFSVLPGLLQLTNCFLVCFALRLIDDSLIIGAVQICVHLLTGLSRWMS